MKFIAFVLKAGIKRCNKHWIYQKKNAE